MSRRLFVLSIGVALALSLPSAAWADEEYDPAYDEPAYVYEPVDLVECAEGVEPSPAAGGSQAQSYGPESTTVYDPTCGLSYSGGSGWGCCPYIHLNIRWKHAFVAAYETFDTLVLGGNTWLLTYICAQSVMAVSGGTAFLIAVPCFAGAGGSALATVVSGYASYRSWRKGVNVRFSR